MIASWWSYSYYRQQISATPTALAAFTTTVGTASTAQAFTVTGTNLLSVITVAPPTGYQVSLSSGSGYAASVTTPQSGAATIVYVRLTTAATGTPSGNVALTSTSAITVNVAVSGTVNAACAATIFSENMQTPTATTTIINYVAGTGTATFQNKATLTYSKGEQTNPADLRVTSASSGYTGASGNGNVFFASTSGAYGFSIEGINTSTYTSLTIDYGYRKESATVFPTFSVDYWDGSAWVTIANTSSTLFNEAASASIAWYAAKQLSLPSAAQINGLKIRFVKTGAASCRIDDVVLRGTSACNSYITSGAGPLTNLSTTYGTASTATSFTLQGTGLGTTISIAALTGFEFANGAGAYATTLNGISATGSTTINVRLAANATAGTHSGNIVCSSGATSLNVPMPTGTVAKASQVITFASTVTKTYGAINYAGATSTSDTTIDYSSI